MSDSNAPFDTLTMARIHLDQGNLDEAEQLLTDALKHAEKLGAFDLRVAISLQDMAEYYCQKGDYGPSTVLYRRSLSIKCRVIGKNHENTMRTRRRIREIQQMFPYS